MKTLIRSLIAVAVIALIAPAPAHAAGFSGRQMVATYATTSTTAVVTNSTDSLKGQVDRLRVTVSGYASPTGSYVIKTSDGLVLATNSFTSATSLNFIPRLNATDSAGSTLTGTASGTNVTVVNSTVVPVSFSGALSLYISRCNDTGVTVTADAILITN